MKKDFKNKVDDFLNDSVIGGAVLTFLIFCSVIAFIFETEYAQSQPLKYINIGIAGLFGFEYFTRIWIASEHTGGRTRYIFSFYGLVDLLAFLPALVIAAAGGSVVLRLLRVLRLVQILKLNSVRRGIQYIVKALKQSRDELVVSSFLSLSLIFMGAIAMYYAEGKTQPEVFGSIPRALWWSMATLTTVGYGDVYPVTALGKIIASAIAIIGIAAVAMPAGILAAAFYKAHTIDDFSEDNV